MLIINHPLYDYNIKYDYSNLPKDLQELIHLLEEYDKTRDWFNYDLKYDELEVDAKSYLISGRISEYDFKMITRKYGGIL